MPIIVIRIGLMCLLVSLKRNSWIKMRSSRSSFFFQKKHVLFCCFKTKKHVFYKKTFVLKQAHICMCAYVCVCLTHFNRWSIDRCKRYGGSHVLQRFIFILHFSFTDENRRWQIQEVRRRIQLSTADFVAVLDVAMLQQRCEKKAFLNLDQ